MSKLPLSVAIISFNEEKNIARTLESIKNIASEIILVDSHSTDNTRKIASSFGTKVFKEKWKGFVEEKNFAFSKCREEWILNLDCDEVVSKELLNAIQDALSKNNKSTDIDGFFLNRRSFYLDKLLKYAWYPDWKLRLVRREASPQWVGNMVHESLSVKGKTGKLSGDLLHYSYSGIEDHFNRTVKYSKLAAESLVAKGKKFRLIKMLSDPWILFFKIYILKRGLLDGTRGLIVACSAFIYDFLKYAFLWDLQRRRKKINKLSS